MSCNPEKITEFTFEGWLWGKFLVQQNPSELCSGLSNEEWRIFAQKTINKHPDLKVFNDI